MRLRRSLGFTLVEILIALFIFSIVSMILMSALHGVISTQSRTELSATKLAQLQMALLITSRDIQQAVNRPIIDAQGHGENAFSGSSTGFVFTHMGYANPMHAPGHSVLQRTAYRWHDHGFWRETWPVVDQAPNTVSHERLLISNVDAVAFEYLDIDGHFQHDWPSHSVDATPLPRAVKLSVTIANWGTISQVYLISAGEGKHATQQAPQPTQ